MKRSEGKKMKITRVLVTGGQGYLGSLVNETLSRSGLEVVSLDSGHVSDTRAALPHVTYEQGDVLEPASWQTALADVDAVVHLAAIVGDPACGVDEDLAMRTNYLGTIRVVEACRRFGVGRIVFASTCSNYGSTEGGQADVWSPLNPQSVYAQTKVLAEHYLLSPHANGPEPCILRFATLYGLSPRMRFDLAVNIMTASAVAQGHLVVHGGSQWRPFLHVRDAASAILKCLHKKPGSTAAVYNCGSNNENYLIKDLAELIQQEVPGSVADVLGDSLDPRNYRVDFSLIRQALSFTNRFRVVDGIREIRQAMMNGAYEDYLSPRYSNYLRALGLSKQGVS
ncbi:NAD(P)-dependent oxidoreductase [Streptomyces sp. NPDC006132]|uniref:NAD-dependent epimerase/dehydratase family protein n=1 Tax=Streptomyces sp. NPDC006132 TaxID=3156732 RepID=UPI0033DC8B82